MDRIGPYQLRGRLGAGAAGVVFRAWDARLDREVAIKLLLGDGATDHRRRRFEREARALAKVRHPNVVGVHAAGFHGAELRPYLVMDLVRGESLQARLDRDGPLPVDEATSLVARVASGLAAAHAEGVLHRDVKPANVIVDEEGEPRLGDFGLAKELDDERRSDSLSADGRFLGTPGFAPPEQVHGRSEAIGPASDVYGLGATLYALLTGDAPFEGDSIVEVILATTNRAPPSPAAGRPDVPPVLDAICLRCLAKEPGARFPSAAALAEALERSLAGEEPRARASMARPALFGLAGAVGVAALVVAAGLLGLDRSGPTGAPTPVAVAASSAGPSPATGSPSRGAVAPTPSAPPYPDTPGPSLSLSAELAVQVTSLLDRSRASMDQGRILDAIASLEEATELDPGNPWMWTILGQAREASGDPDAALADLGRALALAPDFVEAHRGLASAHCTRGDVETALGHHGRALALDPEDAATWSARAYVHELAGDPDAALADLNRAIELGPVDPPWRARRGLLLAARGDVEAALVDLDAFLEAAPYHADVGRIRNHAAMLRSGEDPKAMVIEARELMAEGDRLREAGDLDGACAVWRRALEVDPTAINVLSRLSAAAIERSDLDEALRFASRGVECQPMNGRLWSNQGVIRERLGDLEGAVGDHERAVDLGPTDPDAWANLGVALNKLDRLDAAISAFDRAIALAANHPIARTTRGFCREKRGDLEGALADYDVLLARHPDHAWAPSVRKQADAVRARLGR